MRLLGMAPNSSNESVTSSHASQVDALALFPISLSFRDGVACLFLVEEA